MYQRKKEAKWTRAVLLKRPDSIISSDFTNNVPFKPSYEKEEVSMFRLLAMDYAREWFKQKKNVKEVIVVSNEAVFLQRRYVIRGLLRRLQQSSVPEKRFIMKKFRNIPSRIRSKRTEESQPTKDTKLPTTVGQVGLGKPKRPKVPSCSEISVNLQPSQSQINLLEVCPLKKGAAKECTIGGGDDKDKDGKQKSDAKDTENKNKATDDVKSQASSSVQEKKEKLEKEVETTKGKSQEKIDEPVERSARTKTTLPSSDLRNIPQKEREKCTCECETTDRDRSKRQKLEVGRGDHSESTSSRSSTLTEYKSISRESIENKVNPSSVQKCQLTANKTCRS